MMQSLTSKRSISIHLSIKLPNSFTFSRMSSILIALTAHRVHLLYTGATCKWGHFRKRCGNMNMSDELWDTILILLEIKSNTFLYKAFSGSLPCGKNHYFPFSRDPLSLAQSKFDVKILILRVLSNKLSPQRALKAEHFPQYRSLLSYSNLNLTLRSDCSSKGTDIKFITTLQTSVQKYLI